MSTMTTSNRNLTAVMTAQKQRWGDRYDTSELYAHLAPYFRGNRVRVRSTYPNGTTWERTGVVSITTGWRPAFLLIHRSSDTGSWDVLSQTDRIVAEQVQGGSRNMPVTEYAYFEEYKDHDIIRFEDVKGRQPFMVFPSGAQCGISRHASVNAAKRSIDKKVAEICPT